MAPNHFSAHVIGLVNKCALENESAKKLEIVIEVFDYLQKHLDIWQNSTTKYTKFRKIVLAKIKQMRRDAPECPSISAAVIATMKDMEYKLGYSCCALTKKDLRCKRMPTFFLVPNGSLVRGCYCKHHM